MATPPDMTERAILAGRYELRGVLGCGGMAEVRDGWDIRLNRAVAVKLLLPALCGQPDLRHRFDSEARAAAALSHPNIVSVYDYGEDAGRPFIVMERLPGDTLHDHIAHGPQEPHRARSILDDVLTALTAAHAIGVLHRDIKPGNILVAADGVTMKIGDFGIAKSPGTTHTMTGQIIGTMAYMSPERVAGAPASVADDLYAVGLVGFEVLTGRRAFPQENPAALTHAIAALPPPSLAVERPDVDPLLAGVIDRAISHDPRQRFLTAEQMRAALGRNRDAPFAGAGATALPGAPRPATKVLEQPPGYFVDPASAVYVPPLRNRKRSRRRMVLAAAGVLAAMIVTILAFAIEPSSTTTTNPEPVATSTAPPAPSTSASPAPPPALTANEEGNGDENGELKKPGVGGKGNHGKGNGNGHGKRG